MVEQQADAEKEVVVGIDVASQFVAVVAWLVVVASTSVAPFAVVCQTVAAVEYKAVLAVAVGTIVVVAVVEAGIEAVEHIVEEIVEVAVPELAAFEYSLVAENIVAAEEGSLEPSAADCKEAVGMAIVLRASEERP